MFKKKKEKRPNISQPFNFEQRVAVKEDKNTKTFIGLPKEWNQIIDNAPITHDSSNRRQGFADPSQITPCEIVQPVKTIVVGKNSTLRQPGYISVARSNFLRAAINAHNTKIVQTREAPIVEAQENGHLNQSYGEDQKHHLNQSQPQQTLARLPEEEFDEQTNAMFYPTRSVGGYNANRNQQAKLANDPSYGKFAMGLERPLVSQPAPMPQRKTVSPNYMYPQSNSDADRIRLNNNNNTNYVNGFRPKTAEPKFNVVLVTK